MNSLNRIKKDKSACQETTAPFRAVSSIKRGGLPLRISRSLLLLPLAIFTLFNCEYLFDIAPPEIEIVKPEEGETYFGTLPCQLNVTDNNKVDRVEVFVGDSLVHIFTGEPFSTDIDISTFQVTSATLKIVAHDRAGNWDISKRDFNKWSPTLVGSYNTPGDAGDVFVSGSYAYIADGYGLQIINISNPASPTLAGSYDTPGNAYGVFVTGSYVYIADGYGLQIINVSNPASPVLAGSYDTPNWAYDVFVTGSYAYIADYMGGLQIINVSNPASPTLAGSYAPGYAKDIFVSGSYAYVADVASGLLIFDISGLP